MKKFYWLLHFTCDEFLLLIFVKLCCVISYLSFSFSNHIRKTSLRDEASNLGTHVSGYIRNIFFPDWKISPSPRTHYFPLWRADSKYPDSPDACGPKPYPERKSCGFKSIRIREDGALCYVKGGNGNGFFWPCTHYPEEISKRRFLSEIPSSLRKPEVFKNVSITAHWGQLGRGNHVIVLSDVKTFFVHTNTKTKSVFK